MIKLLTEILVQLPLPKHINESKVLLSISPSKDVDGFHPENVGRLVAGLPSYVPCTPLGIYELLKRYKINLKGKHCVVVGRSNIVGKPIANLLMQKEPNANAIVTVCHSAAPDISYYTKQADVLIAAVGSPELIKGERCERGSSSLLMLELTELKIFQLKRDIVFVGDVNFC
jgi:methylenetetrahydrofolate dehydrogenase (NADP+)/methenyltetrahydrofolate cyclohydrolase